MVSGLTENLKFRLLRWANDKYQVEIHYFGLENNKNYTEIMVF